MDKETILLLAQQIIDTEEVNLHKVSAFLEYALKDIKSKKDLDDGEQLTIQSIRSLIKGL